MSVKCTSCGKKMLFYPFKKATTCIKCSLEENFEKIPAIGVCKLGGH